MKPKNLDQTIQYAQLNRATGDSSGYWKTISIALDRLSRDERIKLNNSRREIAAGVIGIILGALLFYLGMEFGWRF